MHPSDKALFNAVSLKTREGRKPRPRQPYKITMFFDVTNERCKLIPHHHNVHNELLVSRQAYTLKTAAC